MEPGRGWDGDWQVEEGEVSALPLESAGMSGAQSPSKVKSQVKGVAAAPWRKVLPATYPARSPRLGLAISFRHTAPYKARPGLPCPRGRRRRPPVPPRKVPLLRAMLGPGRRRPIPRS